VSQKPLVLISALSLAFALLQACAQSAPPVKWARWDGGQKGISDLLVSYPEGWSVSPAISPSHAAGWRKFEAGGLERFLAVFIYPLQDNLIKARKLKDSQGRWNKEPSYVFLRGAARILGVEPAYWEELPGPNPAAAFHLVMGQDRPIGGVRTSMDGRIALSGQRILILQCGSDSKAPEVGIGELEAIQASQKSLCRSFFSSLETLDSQP
jgi:hypothetical protein